MGNCCNSCHTVAGPGGPGRSPRPPFSTDPSQPMRSLTPCQMVPLRTRLQVNPAPSKARFSWLSGSVASPLAAHHARNAA